MSPTESPSVSVTRRAPRPLGSDPLRTVVWVHGDHDTASRVDLSMAFTEAVRLDDADIVVDLGGVTFMDASTIGVLVDGQNRLRALSRSLSVRNPSPSAQYLLDLCGLAPLIDEHPASPPLPLPPGTALGTWVSVPAREHGTASAQPPDTTAVPVHDPVEATPARNVEPARAIQRRRAPP